MFGYTELNYSVVLGFS